VEKRLDFWSKQAKLKKRSMNLLFKRVFHFFKGSSKDPFNYFGIISAILLGIVSFAPLSLLNDTDNYSSLTPLSFQLSKNSGEQNLYLSSTEKFWLESPEFFLVQKTSLVGISPPVMVLPQVLGALVSGFEPEESKKIIVEYIIEPGDSLWLIAAKFDISFDTLLWANDLNKNSIIQPGQKLVIPPVSGVIHYVKSGDTISEMAKKYKGKIDEILAFNELSSEGDIYVGDVIIIPNGVMPAPAVRYTPPLVPLASSYFICPVVGGCRITQGRHWYNAVDFSNGKCGEPILAAADGKVLKVKLTSSTSRWAFGGAGNHLTILHPNGVVTMYGHLQSILVSPGQPVSQGQVIALMGGQPGTPGAGKSTGCHLHFGVSGAKNPFR